MTNREPGRLPHLLPTRAYFDPGWAEDERRRLLGPAWHLVATEPELARPGDYVTTRILGCAVQVRNFGGELVALSNVCSHRHCLLRSAERGRDSRLACPYHGWEFDAHGRTRTLPDPVNFAPFDREADALPRYRLERCGQLVFVCLDPSAPSLGDQLGPMASEVVQRFGPDWRPTLRDSLAQGANWKVVVENTLESYHVPCVHPWTLREDPGEARGEQQLGLGQTSFATRHFAAQSRLDRALHRLERLLLRTLGRSQVGTYRHHHVFPNLLFAFTDTLSLAMCVLPEGPAASRIVVRQFGPGGGVRRGPLSVVCSIWGFALAQVTARVMEEDRRLMPALQGGLEASPHAGCLGWCERRIHAFQAHVQARVAAAAGP
jgi:phenylpropionate dioxygenase-like ring-hydroxylating dioxygenase large terminal subunit